MERADCYETRANFSQTAECHLPDGSNIHIHGSHADFPRGMKLSRGPSCSTQLNVKIMNYRLLSDPNL